MKKISYLRVVLACLMAVTFVNIANAQNFLEKQAATINPYITSDVVAIAFIDLENFNLDKAMELATQIGFGDGDKLEDIKELAPMIKAEISKLKDAGLTNAIALMRMSDIQDRGTSWLFPVAQGVDPRTAAKSLAEHPICKTMLLQNFGSGDGVVLAGTTQSQVDRLKSERAGQPRDFADSWKACGTGTAGLVVFGDADSRRVLRELMPELPGPFAALNGNLVANDIKWVGVTVELGEKVNAIVEVQANNEDAAKVIAATAEAGMTMLQSMPQIDFIAKDQLEYLAKSLAPVRDGKRVTISTSKLMEDRDRLTKVLGPFVGKLKAAAAQSKRLNTIRQIALGMHNYESAHKHFPTQAIVDKTGKPLLSWRVQILPFIEQNALYKQFHLDEPWDSEHNLKLVAKMPAIYADGNRKNNKAGKTVYQVPAGPGLIFDGGNEITFGKMTDGSSNTILAVCVAQKHAAIWTKPDDWEVDFASPESELTEEGRKFVEIALADGSNCIVPLGSSEAKRVWEFSIRHNDGEIVTLDDFDSK